MDPSLELEVPRKGGVHIRLPTDTLQEVFSGPMLAFMGNSIPDMTETFEEFVNGLKTRAEGRD